MGRDISRTTKPIRTKIPPFDSSSLGKSNGGIFVRIGSVVREISRSKVSGSIFLFKIKINALFPNTLSLNSPSFGEFNGSNFYKYGLVIQKISCFKVIELILIF